MNLVIKIKSGSTSVRLKLLSRLLKTMDAFGSNTRERMFTIILNLWRVSLPK